MLKKDILVSHIDEIRELKKQKVGNGKIAAMYGVSVPMVQAFLADNGFGTKSPITANIKRRIIDEYTNQKRSIAEIGARCQRDANFISSLLQLWDIPIQGTTVRNQKYHVNQDFFEVIDTEEKAYILGFILADGGVVGNNLSISLQEGDKNLLENILSVMESNHPLKFRDYSKARANGRLHQQDQWTLRMKNKKIVSDLAKYGVVQNKSLKTYYPQNVPDELFRHLLRGIFDGDGYICKTENRFQLTGCEMLLSVILEKLVNMGLVTKGTMIDACGNGITKTLRIHGFDNCKNVFDFMYKDACIYLERKYQVYLNRFC